ncbi:MFS transporter [Algimonas arctica]|uniref:MFS transporter n=1 Tax=Algimonas arctica TaxID=1479486 RepID=A0A8J3CV40_9PROT|nr:MFS transporter [Algimonas arctica]GHB04302.1 MFS transporter [Algimonas arctica]
MALSNTHEIAPAPSGLLQLKPNLPILSIINMAVGFFGLQIGFALQNANASRIFSTLGSNTDTLALYWLAGPVTGLIMQPIVGYLSDQTWTRFGRRRPYFLLGALLASFALIFMPNSPALWIAASSLWILDASLNISMEPFRAFVGDNLNTKQRTLGYAIQGFFIGAGGYVGSKLPEWATALGAANTADANIVPDSVKLAFLLGAAILFASVLYTVVTSKEYDPDTLHAFEAADNSALAHARRETPTVPPAAWFSSRGLIALFIGGGLLALVAFGSAEKQLAVFAVMVVVLGLLLVYNAWRLKGARAAGMIGSLMDDLATMPLLMKRLALVQFTSWFAFFTLWVYLNSAVTSHHFGTTDPTSEAFGVGSLAVNNIFAIYSLVAWGFSLLIPIGTRGIGLKPFYALSLLIGGFSFISIWLFPPSLFWLSAVGIGVVWACILTLPYALLADALPAGRMGTYMGIFNYFIVIPQLVVGTIMGSVLTGLLGGQTVLTLVIAGGVMMSGAVLLIFVPYEKPLDTISKAD